MKKRTLLHERAASIQKWSRNAKRACDTAQEVSRRISKHNQNTEVKSGDLAELLTHLRPVEVPDGLLLEFANQEEAKFKKFLHLQLSTGGTPLPIWLTESPSYKDYQQKQHDRLTEEAVTLTRRNKLACDASGIGMDLIGKIRLTWKVTNQYFRTWNYSAVFHLPSDMSVVITDVHKHDVTLRVDDMLREDIRPPNYVTNTLRGVSIQYRIHRTDISIYGDESVNLLSALFALAGTKFIGRACTKHIARYGKKVLLGGECTYSDAPNSFCRLSDCQMFFHMVQVDVDKPEMIEQVTKLPKMLAVLISSF
jgi:hypothetical protein